MLTVSLTHRSKKIIAFVSGLYIPTFKKYNSIEFTLCYVPIAVEVSKGIYETQTRTKA